MQNWIMAMKWTLKTGTKLVRDLLVEAGSSLGKRAKTKSCGFYTRVLLKWRIKRKYLNDVWGPLLKRPLRYYRILANFDATIEQTECLLCNSPFFESLMLIKCDLNWYNLFRQKLKAPRHRNLK